MDFKKTFNIIGICILFLGISCSNKKLKTSYNNTNTNTDFPNILLIIADDLGVDMSNGYQVNANMPSTPNLDKLREDGLTFTNTWATPQCSPSRAAIMSGKYGIKTGIIKPPGNLDLKHQSIFSKLKSSTNNTYKGAVIGKWHLSHPKDYQHPQQHGIDHYEGLFSFGVEDYFNWEKITNGVISQETEYVTSNLTSAAIDWIKEQNQPWFLWLAHAAPHTPFHTPPSNLISDSNPKGKMNQYLAAIEAMDSEIGRLLDKMDEATLDNTLIIFVGDNGTPKQVVQNFPRQHGKASLYEGGIRVPMIISGKGVSRKNEKEKKLIHIVDLYATILELAGDSLPEGIHNSKSIKSMFTNSKVEGRKYVYTDGETRRVRGWAIRNKDYKLIQYEDNTEEFYDISTDLLESNNLINKLSSTQQIIKEDLANQAQSIRNN